MFPPTDPWIYGFCEQTMFNTHEIEAAPRLDSLDYKSNWSLFMRYIVLHCVICGSGSQQGDKEEFITKKYLFNLDKT